MISLPTTILVPVDGSEHSIETLKRAIGIAAKVDCTIDILQVVEPVIYPGLQGSVGMVEHPPVQEIADARFASVKEMLDAQDFTGWTRHVQEGMPAERIVAFAEDQKCDLIVIGSRGASAVERFLFGSVADRVVHHAPCDVWVVK